MHAENGTRRKTSFRGFLSKYGAGYLFLAPALILLIVFIVLPVVIAIVLSLTDYNMYQMPNFIGLTNYKLLIMDDDIFLKAIQNTLVFEDQLDL